ncbi:MAG: hypothetical protein WD058_09230, partial [Dehalococcoidia bacterium]
FAGFLNGAPRLHSVVEAAPQPAGAEASPHGAYWLVYDFTTQEGPTDDGALSGAAGHDGARLHVLADGGVAGLWYGCGATLDVLGAYAGEALPVIWDADVGPG